MSCHRHGSAALFGFETLLYQRKPLRLRRASRTRLSFAAGQRIVPSPSMKKGTLLMSARDTTDLPSAPSGSRAELEALGWSGDDLVRSWVGEVAPTVADKAASFIFHELYSLQQMPVKYRELVIAAIISATGGLPDGAVQHVALARKEGATTGEVDEMFAMVAAYAGFPKAIAAARACQRQSPSVDATE